MPLAPPNDQQVTQKRNVTMIDTMQAELREREVCLGQQIETLAKDRKKAEDVALRAADVFQLILEKWPTADFSVKRRILEIAFSNFMLVGDQLVPGNRTPFELLAAG